MFSCFSVRVRRLTTITHTCSSGSSLRGALGKQRVAVRVSQAMPSHPWSQPSLPGFPGGRSALTSDLCSVCATSDAGGNDDCFQSVFFPCCTQPSSSMVLITVLTAPLCFSVNCYCTQGGISTPLGTAHTNKNSEPFN